MSPTTADYVTMLGNDVQATPATQTPNDAASYFNMLYSQGVPVEQANAATAALFPGAAAAPAATAAAPAPGTFDTRGGYTDEFGHYSPPPGGGGGALPVSAPPRPPASPLPVGAGGGTSGPAFGPNVGLPGAAPTLSLPNTGEAYYAPLLGLIGQLLGFGNSNRQNELTALTNLGANPKSAAELATYRGLQGMSPFGDNGGDIRGLIASPTSAGGNNGAQGVQWPGQSAPINIPNTLSGSMLNMLKGMPGTSDVISSIAGAAGNPDIMARSRAALMPALFGSGSLGFGTTAGFGAGSGLM